MSKKPARERPSDDATRPAEERTPADDGEASSEI